MREYMITTILLGVLVSVWVILTTKNRTSWFYLKVILFSIIAAPIIPLLSFVGLPEAMRNHFRD